MTTAYPAALDAYGDPTGGQVMGLTTPTHSGHHTNHNDAIEAIEVKLGTGAGAPPASAAVLRRTATGASGWGLIAAGDHAAGAIATADLAAGAVSVRPAVAVGTTNPVTTNTAIAALANPTLSITTTAVATDIYAWCSGRVSDSPGGALVIYYLRIDGGAWIGVGEQATAADSPQIFGFHIFGAVAAGAHTIEMGNSANVSSNSITHYGSTRRMMALGIAR